MKREEILKDALNCVCGRREQDYGSPENNFKTIGAFWTTYLGAAHPDTQTPVITPKDVAMMMALLKTACISAGNKADSFVDLAGYAACAGELTDDWIKDKPDDDV